MDHTSHSQKSKRSEALRKIGEALLILADIDDQDEPARDDNLPIPLELLCELFRGTTKAYWRDRVKQGDVPGVRLARQKIGVRPSDARACIEAHPAIFKLRKVEPDVTDPVERAIAAGRVQRGGR